MTAKRQVPKSAFKPDSPANCMTFMAKQKAFYTACNLYDRVLPFDRWIKQARPDQLAYAKLIGGTVEGGYARMTLEIAHLALYLKVQMDKENINAAC